MEDPRDDMFRRSDAIVLTGGMADLESAVAGHEAESAGADGEAESAVRFAPWPFKSWDNGEMSHTWPEEALQALVPRN